jgi:hypothetical protein
MAAIDTLKLAKSLRNHGVDELAEGIAEGINEGLGETLSTLVTKDDLNSATTALRTEMSNGFSALRNEIKLSSSSLRNQMWATAFAVVVALGLIQHFFK